MRSADVYCAPNTGGESFGIVLVEAMAAGTAVVASDLDAFRRVLVDGKAGRLVPVDDADGLAAGLIEVLENDVVRGRYVEAAAEAVRRYDWSVVAGQIMRVYETVAGVRGEGAGGRADRPGVGDHVRWSCCWRVVILLVARVGAIRPPTGWTGCTSATTCPGRRSTARWPGARWWRARSPSTPTAAGPEGKRLAALADAAERAPRAGREAAENELSAALALVDPASLPVALVAELADAEARVLLARRFHNDAVRDTLALRERPAVRMLRLGGTAALPTYFEIAERGATRDVGVVNRRMSARVVLLDDDGAVLLFCGSDPANEDGERAALVVHRRRGGPAGGDAGRGRGARAGGGDRAAGRPGRHGRAGVAARCGHRLQRVGHPQRGDVLRAPHRAVRAVRRRAAPALERRLHPRPPLVRCDNDRRAGRQG